MATVFGHCAQQICLAFAQDLGLSEEQAVGLSAPFGCGFGNGDTCGCYTAGLMLLGLRYGRGAFATFPERHNELVARVSAFQEQFAKLQSAISCREIVGIDVTKGDGMSRAMESGRISAVCHPLIEDTVCILEQIFSSSKEEKG